MELLKRLLIAAAIGAAAIVLLARVMPPNGQSAHLPGVLVYAILCEIIPLFVAVLGTPPLPRPLSSRCSPLSPGPFPPKSGERGLGG